jgi:hypothetical protein
MKRRVRPVLYARDQAVLHRVDVDVIDVPREVAVVRNCMFPKPTLPQRILALAIVSNRFAYGDHLMGEDTLDAPPATGEIRVTGRQSHDDMQMVGENNDSIDREWPFLASRAKRGAQCRDSLDQHARPPIEERHGEEERSAGNEVAPVANHSDLTDYGPALRCAPCGLQAYRPQLRLYAATVRPTGLTWPALSAPDTPR